MTSKLNAVRDVLTGLIRRPSAARRLLAELEPRLRGERLLREWPLRTRAQADALPGTALTTSGENRLRAYFDSLKDGPGVWKWLHYFDLYDRHFRKFVGRDVVVVEIGVFSGGSLPMWRHYFGDGCQVHGIDINPDCRCYAAPGVTIHIGDQADRTFWQRFRSLVPQVDILIDDGGHLPEQQIVTAEEMLPHLRLGGVYVCEDVHGAAHPFAAFVAGMVDQLNHWGALADTAALGSQPSAAQAAIASVHCYPFSVVVELRDQSVETFVSARHGSEWRPFQPAASLSGANADLPAQPLPTARTKPP